MNQHMKLLVFLTVGISLRANQLVIPPALSRDTFATLTAHWQEEPASSLWDLPSIQRLLSRHMINMTVADDNLIPADAIHLPRTARVGLGTIVGDAKWKVNRRLEQLRRRSGWGAWKRKGGKKSREAAASPPPVYPIHIHADNFFFMLITQNLTRYADVARGVKFNPTLVDLAATIAANLRAASPTGLFNGLHLRVEKDWTDAKLVTEREQREDLAEYADLMHAARFSESPCYIASGIFEKNSGRINRDLYGRHEEWLHRNASIKAIVNRHTCIEGLLPVGGLTSLHSEQGALLDFLVLQHADTVVGFGRSSFSYNLREYRALNGRPRGTTRLVNAAKVATPFELTASIAV